MANHNDKIVILITAGSHEEAYNIGKDLVEKKLAACCNIVQGVQSIYWWEGKVTEDSEILLMIKTRISAEEAVFKAVKETHSYQLPEIISLPITGGYDKYFDWIDNSVVK